MKKAVSIFLLFIFLVPCIYKCGVVAYFELNQDYIANTLCVNRDKPITMCYGKCFLDKALNATDEKTNTSSLTQVKLQVSDYTLNDFIFSLDSKKLISIFPFTKAQSLCNGISLSVFRPPLA